MSRAERLPEDHCRATVDRRSHGEPLTGRVVERHPGVQGIVKSQILNIKLL